MLHRRFGPFQLVRQIATGGMAEIYLAKTAGLAGFEKYVAIKMIHESFARRDRFVQMLIDEAKIAVKLNHRNIVQTFDLGRVGDRFYITMEYVDGADLFQILCRAVEMGMLLRFDICAFIAREVANALDHAHHQLDHDGKPLHIVHRDVSPQNVLVSRAGDVKLTDFGIAKATTKEWQTAVGVIQGKYCYMSPEQAWGETIDMRSDVFSAGIVLYEMLTGRMVYREQDLIELVAMARRANIPPPTTIRPDIPRELERIAMRALARDRQARYQRASDLSADLDRFLTMTSPGFRAASLASLVAEVGAEPPLVIHELVRNKSEIRDENSVLFRLWGDGEATEPSVEELDAGDRTLVALDHGIEDSEIDTLTAPLDDLDPTAEQIVLGRTVRGTPPHGMPRPSLPNLLQQIIAAAPKAAMPEPRRTEDSATLPLLSIPAPPPPLSAGILLAVPTPTPGRVLAMVPGVPAHLQPYAHRSRPLPGPPLFYRQPEDVGLPMFELESPQRVWWKLAVVLALAVVIGAVAAWLV